MKIVPSQTRLILLVSVKPTIPVVIESKYELVLTCHHPYFISLATCKWYKYEAAKRLKMIRVWTDAYNYDNMKPCIVWAHGSFIVNFRSVIFCCPDTRIGWQLTRMAFANCQPEFRRLVTYISKQFLFLMAVDDHVLFHSYKHCSFLSWLIVFYQGLKNTCCSGFI